MKASSVWIFLMVICCGYAQADDAAPLPFSSNSSENETAVPIADTSGGSFSIPAESAEFNTSNAWNGANSKTSARRTSSFTTETSFATATPSKKKSKPARSADSQVWIAALIAIGGLGVVIVGVAMMRGQKRSRRGRSMNYETRAGDRQRPAKSAALAAQLIQAHNNANMPSGDSRGEVQSRRAA